MPTTGRESEPSPDPRRIGESAAFRRFFEDRYTEVFRLAYRITGLREEAEDIAQETFLRLWRQPASLPEGASARAWIFRVASNLALNARRDRRRLEERHAQATATGPRHASAEEDPLVRAEERERVRRVLDSLPERQRTLLILRYSGLSYRELAEAMDLTPSSVGSLLSRAEVAFERVFAESAAPTENV